ncbi:MAG: hypothetical protein J4428_02040 [Candidatus Aenigmarchaeota archaeon]|nr:hypothetical protein [Candidatus Aenigmarchaeota archaeon]
MNAKQVSISSYSDLEKLSPNIKIVHFRKFLNKKLIEKVLLKCPNIKKISCSKSAFRRNSGGFGFLEFSNIQLSVSEKDRGRPNLLEKMIF